MNCVTTVNSTTCRPALLCCAP